VTLETCHTGNVLRVIKFAKLHRPNLPRRALALLLLLRWSPSAAMQAAGSSVGSKEQDEIELLQQREVTVRRGKQPEDEYKLMFFDVEGVGWVVSAQQLWKGPMRSRATGPVRESDISSAWSKAFVDEGSTPSDLQACSLPYPDPLHRFEQLALSPDQVMQVFMYRIGTVAAPERLLLARSFVEPMTEMLSNTSTMSHSDWVSTFAGFFQKAGGSRPLNSLVDLIQNGMNDTESTARQRQGFAKLHTQMLERLVRGKTLGDRRPFEELLPRAPYSPEDRVQEASMLGKAKKEVEAVRKGKQEAEQRSLGLLRSVVALARPGAELDPDGSMEAMEGPELKSALAFLDFFLFKNRLQILKALVISGSKSLRDAMCVRPESEHLHSAHTSRSPRSARPSGAHSCVSTDDSRLCIRVCCSGGFLWSRCVSRFEAERRRFTYLMKQFFFSRRDLSAGGLLSQLTEGMEQAIGLRDDWVELRNRSLFAPLGQADKEHNVQVKKQHMLPPLLTADGKVSIAFDTPLRVKELWEWPRSALLVLPPGAPVEIIFNLDSAGLNKKGWPCTTGCWSFASKPSALHSNPQNHSAIAQCEATECACHGLPRS
jgi:hypothetical protein